jgi:hypothetical protein
MTYLYIVHGLKPDLNDVFGYPAPIIPACGQSYMLQEKIVWIPVFDQCYNPAPLMQYTIGSILAPRNSPNRTSLACQAPWIQVASAHAGNQKVSQFFCIRSCNLTKHYLSLKYGSIQPHPLIRIYNVGPIWQPNIP